MIKIDYIYGELNQQVEKNTYQGGKTTTTSVLVDNNENIIYVDANFDQDDVQRLIDNTIATLDVTDTISANKFVVAVNETNGLVSTSKRGLVIDDLPDEIPEAKIKDLVVDLAKIDEKQDLLGFEGTYDKETNKVVTNNYLLEKIPGIGKFIGISTTDPIDGPDAPLVTIDGQLITPKQNDTCCYPDSSKEYFFNGNSWVIKRDDSNVIRHVENGDITDSDIKVNAAIAQKKTYGLRTTNNNTLCDGIGYLDKIDILVSDEDTPDSIANQIKTAVEALSYTDTEEKTGTQRKFATVISETDGIISITKHEIIPDDLPQIPQEKVENLQEDIETLETGLAQEIIDRTEAVAAEETARIQAVAIEHQDRIDTINTLNLDEVEFTTGEILWTISETAGKISVEKRALVSTDMPNDISQLKIAGSEPNTTLVDDLAAKQDKLAFEGEYSKTANKVVTNNYLLEKIQGLGRFIGTSTTDPINDPIAPNVKINGVIITPKENDSCYYPDSFVEYSFNGVHWSINRDYHDVIRHKLGGDISDTDIISNADIAQTKIFGLRTSDKNTLRDNIGYLDRIDILVGPDSTPDSIAYQIKEAIETLKESLEYTDEEEFVDAQRKFATVISEADGVISVTKHALVLDDLPVIPESKITNLTNDLANINNAVTQEVEDRIAAIKALNFEELEFSVGEHRADGDTLPGEVIWKISESEGTISVSKTRLTDADIPTLSYTKLNDWMALVADWAETNNTKPSFIKNKPTIIYNNTKHCLTFNGI